MQHVEHRKAEKPIHLCPLTAILVKIASIFQRSKMIQMIAVDNARSLGSNTNRSPTICFQVIGHLQMNCGCQEAEGGVGAADKEGSLVTQSAEATQPTVQYLVSIKVWYF